MGSAPSKEGLVSREDVLSNRVCEKDIVLQSIATPKSSEQHVTRDISNSTVDSNSDTSNSKISTRNSRKQVKHTGRENAHVHGLCEDKWAEPINIPGSRVVYVQSKGSCKEHTQNRQNVEDVTPHKVRKKEDKTDERFRLDNSDILKSGGCSVFSNRNAVTVGIGGNNSKHLAPIPVKKPGQMAIFEQLGQQGILPPVSVTDKALGELKEAGMIGVDHMASAGYSPSITDNIPRRLNAPRLSPMLPKRIETIEFTIEQRAPWEKDLLQNDQNGYINIKATKTSNKSQPGNIRYESCTPDLQPTMKNSLGQQWDDEVMPLGIEGLNSGDKMKIRMMDLDLM